MPSIKDNILAQIPTHIIESYPRFYDFIRAYYEWLSVEGNGYERINNHLDYMAFEKSIDEYVDFMKSEYLVDVPNQVLLDKELFIKWSRKFNLARGSHESYKFLFKLLFNEQNTEIYVPKDNVLKTSDGNWISGESVMLLTHSNNNTNDFQYQIITQTRPVYQEIVETATAVVQRVRTKYSGRFIVTELSISNIEGEFKAGFPVVAETGAQEWLIPTLTNTEIIDQGTNYQSGQRLFINAGYDNFNVSRSSETNNSFDTRVTSFINKIDVSVTVNSNVLADSEFEFDGRYVSSSQISIGDFVVVNLPTYDGYIIVDETKNGGVNSIEILESPIGDALTSQSLFNVGLGSDFVGSASVGVVRGVKGYYEDTKGHLSSNMYLQDSFFYQNYSYSIKTQQDFTAYASIVKQLLHPAGFAFFGQINFTRLLELIITLEEESVYSSANLDIIHKYGLGTNYNLYNKAVDGFDYKLYKTTNIDSDYLNGESGYNLESEFLSRLDQYTYQPLKGWMDKTGYTDFHLFVPQDYTEEDESAYSYFETGYTSEITV